MIVRFHLVQGSSEDEAGEKKKKGQGVHIAATAGPTPLHHQPTASGISSQEGSTTSSNHDVSGKRSSASRFAMMLYIMSAGE